MSSKNTSNKNGKQQPQSELAPYRLTDPCLTADDFDSINPDLLTSATHIGPIALPADAAETDGQKAPGDAFASSANESPCSKDSVEAQAESVSRPLDATACAPSEGPYSRAIRLIHEAKAAGRSPPAVCSARTPFPSSSQPATGPAEVKHLSSNLLGQTRSEKSGSRSAVAPGSGLGDFAWSSWTPDPDELSSDVYAAMNTFDDEAYASAVPNSSDHDRPVSSIFSSYGEAYPCSCV